MALLRPGLPLYLYRSRQAAPPDHADHDWRDGERRERRLEASLDPRRAHHPIAGELPTGQGPYLVQYLRWQVQFACGHVTSVPGGISQRARARYLPDE